MNFTVMIMDRIGKYASIKNSINLKLGFEGEKDEKNI